MKCNYCMGIGGYNSWLQYGLSFSQHGKWTECKICAQRGLETVLCRDCNTQSHNRTERCGICRKRFNEKNNIRRSWSIQADIQIKKWRQVSGLFKLTEDDVYNKEDE